MKHFLFILFLLALCACKTQQCTVHDAQCTVIRDSVSVTYHPGTVLSLTDSTDSTDCAPTCGGAIKKEQIPQKVRIDTLIVERWHTTEVKVESESGKAKLAKPVKPAKLVFYKNCTRGFWILLLCLLGKIGFKILRGFVFRR